MENEHAVQLRLRFYKDVPEAVTEIRSKFEQFKTACPADYSIKVNDTHIWFHIVGAQKQYYSPHLHLQLEEHRESGTHIRGLFGPDPTLWTLFMFLHFVVAGIFLIFGNNGVLTVNVNSGNPATYQIITGPVTTDVQSSNVFNNLPPGQYQIIATDVCGNTMVQTYTLLPSTPGLTLNFGTVVQPLLSCNTINVSKYLS